MAWATARKVVLGDLSVPSLDRRIQVLGALWLTVGAALIVGTLVGGVLTLGLASTGASVGAPNSAAVPDRRSVNVIPASDETAGATMRYGGVSWTLNEARVVPRSGDPFSRPVVVAETAITNTNDVAVRVRVADVFVVGLDDRRYPADRFEQKADAEFITLDAGASQPLTVVFKPFLARDPQLSELRLMVAEPNRSPASLALNGDDADSPYPLAGTVDDRATVVEVPAEEGGGHQVVVRVLGAIQDLDAGTYRAEAGQIVTRFEVQVQSGAPEPSAAHRQPEFWTLVTPDGAAPPIRVDPVGRSAGADRLDLVFITDDNGTDGLELEVGGEHVDRVSIPVWFSTNAITGAGDQ